MKNFIYGATIKNRYEKASLTVEAALIMPIFLYFIIAFLYLIQIFSLQEQIQTAITKMGLGLSKTAYLYNDFTDLGEVLNFDDTIFEGEYDFGLKELADTAVQGALIKAYARNYLDAKHINITLIQNGFEGISFYSSKVLDDKDCIDIIARYRIRLPIKMFVLEDMRMIQRVRVRAWTGQEVPCLYSIDEEQDIFKDTIVYVTETGTVYHTNKTCSHIKLSVRPIVGIPDALRNSYGSKYRPCERCCEGEEDTLATYYITTEGSKYHTFGTCSAIKRNVKEISLTEVNGKLPCKRCSGNRDGK